MSPLLRQCSVLPIILCASLLACASGGAHENFKSIMQGDIGRNMDDPYAYRNGAKRLYVTTRRLPNGNEEEEFRGGRGSCRVFFEIDNKAARIVGWRYEGSQDDCAIVP